MDEHAAIDRLDLIALLAAESLCPHAEGGACLPCSMSVLSRTWQAAATLGAVRRPPTAEPEPAPLVAPQPR